MKINGEINFYPKQNVKEILLNSSETLGTTKELMRTLLNIAMPPHFRQ